MKNVTAFPLKALASACLLALPLLSPPAHAQTAPPADAQSDTKADSGDSKVKLGTVVVTGSNLRRADKETPSPVQVLSSEELKQSGYNSIQDVLHDITANNMGSLSQANAEAFAAGGGGVSLRGLTVGATLVLIDGHRMASYPMPDDGERDFVDLASIPFEAVERIEILKDGASAVYGSDAMAGVVNVILKKNIVGTSMFGETGTSYKGGGMNQHLGVTTGHGDLGTDGYNAYVSLEYRHQSPIALSARPYLAITDWTPYGGADLSSGSSPYYQIQPKTQNINLLGRFTKLLSDSWSFNVQASMLQSAATQVGVFNYLNADSGNGTTTTPTLAWGPANSNSPVVGQSGPIVVPSGYAGGQLTDLGPQTQKAVTTSYRLVGELSGDIGGWTVDASIGFTRAQTKLTSLNFVSASALSKLTNSGAYYIPAVTPANPYAPLTGVTAATYAALTPPQTATSNSDLDFASLRGTTEIATLAGGPLSIGIGTDLLFKKLNEQFANGFSSGDQSSPIYSFAVGSQTIYAAYAELVAPVLKTLEIDAAARVDHYNTYGSSMTPKVGMKFTPMKELTVRGTYAKGFRAPNIAESGVSGSTSGVLAPVIDPMNGASVQIPELQLSNPALKPEKSTSYTLGLILEPNHTVNLSLDYYDIKIKNQISSPGLLGSIQFAAAYDPQNPNSTTTANNPYLSTLYRNPDGSLSFETYKFVNASETHTNGIDADFRLNFDLGEMGKLSSDLDYTHVIKYDADFFGTNYPLAGTHGPGFVSGDTGTPQDRVQLATTWKQGGWEVTGTVNYVSGMSVLDPSYGNTTCDLALPKTFPNGNAPAQFCHVASFTTFNLAAKYQVNSHLSVHASAVNLFNRRAPYDLQTFGSAGNGAQNGGAPYNPALHEDGAIGAFYMIGANYTF